MPKIYGNTVGVSSLPKSYVLETKDGTQKLVGVLVGEEAVFDATPNDVRINKTFAGEDGLQIGEKIIPSYHTVAGIKIVTPNKQVSISIPSSAVDNYNYTKLQIIICLFNTKILDSVSAEHVCINDNVYNVRSTESISTVVKNHDSKTIDLGIVNESNTPYIIRYFTYKEIE